MPANRGSTTSILAIAETTPGVTPTDPAMEELPLVSFTPRGSYNVVRSNAIRAHPFPDKILEGAVTTEFGLEFELGRDHDLLWETFLGVDFASDAAKFTDALKTLSIEKRTGAGSSLFDHFLGSHFNSASVSVSANDTAPVQVTFNGRSLATTWDDAASIADSDVAAGTNDPFTFAGGELTLNSVATKIISGTINLERAIDPLYEVGDVDPTEYIPGACTATGTMTVAYRDGAQSALFESFANAPQVYVFKSKDASKSRTFTFPQTKFVSFGRGVSGRGVITQEINWEAQFDSGSATIMTMSRDET